MGCADWPSVWLMQELFGGALAVSLSGEWLDASDLRPVPDHQEVWMERDGSHRALVIEIMEMVDAPDSEAAAVHFEEMSNTNGAVKAEVLISRPMSHTLSPGLRDAGPALELRGEQELADATMLQMNMGLLRLRTQTTDLLVSLSRSALIRHFSPSNNRCPTAQTLIITTSCT